MKSNAEKTKEEIRFIINHYISELRRLENQQGTENDGTRWLEIANIMKQYKDQATKFIHRFNSLEPDIYKHLRITDFPELSEGYKNSESLTFDQQALEWWPFLSKLVREVNWAAMTRDRSKLDEIFVYAVNILGMKVEKQEIKTAKAITVSELEARLWCLLQVYRDEVKEIARRRRKLKNPTGTRGHLREATLNQYRSAIKNWPEKQRVLKREIQEVCGEIKCAKKATILEFRDGMTLRVYPGGQQAAS